MLQDFQAQSVFREISEKISCKSGVAVWRRVWWDGWRYLEVVSDKILPHNEWIQLRSVRLSISENPQIHWYI